MKAKKSKKQKPVNVRVVKQPLDVAVAAKPFLVSVFEAREVAPGGRVMGPLGGLDLTGYSEYRLSMHIAGIAGTPFSIRELFGPAGTVDQLTFDVGGGQIGPRGVLNYRASFDIFGPKNLFIQISNDGTEPLQIDGSLYAVR